MKKIVGVSRDTNRNILSFKLDDESIVSYLECAALIATGEIEGYTLSTSKFGDVVIRGVGDGDPSNNLQGMPNY